MCRYLFKAFATLLLACCMAGCSGHKQQSEPVASNGVPMISFESDSYDFGTIAQGEKVSHTFTFRNIGDGNLQINDVTTSCGCTASKFTIEPVAPGETGHVDIIFDSYGRAGRQLKSANVWTNCSQDAVKLQILVNIETTKQ